MVAVMNTTRALDKLELSTADQGKDMPSVALCSTRLTGNLSAKAYYRRALARNILKDEEAAEADLITAHNLVPTDSAIESELAKLRQRKKEQRDREKKAYKKLFA